MAVSRGEPLITVTWSSCRALFIAEFRTPLLEIAGDLDFDGCLAIALFPVGGFRFSFARATNSVDLTHDDFTEEHGGDFDLATGILVGCTFGLVATRSRRCCRRLAGLCGDEDLARGTELLRLADFRTLCPCLRVWAAAGLGRGVAFLGAFVAVLAFVELVLPAERIKVMNHCYDVE